MMQCGINLIWQMIAGQLPESTLITTTDQSTFLRYWFTLAVASLKNLIAKITAKASIMSFWREISQTLLIKNPFFIFA